MRIVLLFLLVVQLVWGQQLPQNDFISPLQIPLYSSGNFGELRSNHFHSGLDLKTNGVTHLPVLAVADGHVSRIKISFKGYGKAVYITHPNGYTTVYAHLARFAPKLEAFVKKQQYAAKDYEIEVFPKYKELNFKKGDTLAFSGNTGASSAPHLHFEIRESISEKIVNPLLFGFDKWMKDQQKPLVKSVLLYTLGTDDVADALAVKHPIGLTLQKDGSYIADLVYAKGTLGFGIQADDFFDQNYSPNGVYKVRCYRNGDLVYAYTMNNFAFDETRYINHFIDFERLKTHNQWIQKLFYKEPYPLSIIEKNTQNGTIVPLPNQKIQYRIEVSDFHNNTQIIHIPIVYKEENPQYKTAQKTPYFIKHKKENVFELQNVSVQMPPHTFYEDFHFNFEVNAEKVRLHNPTVPVHTPITLQYNLEQLPQWQSSQTYIARIVNKDTTYYPTTYKAPFLSAKIKELGTFVLQKDSLPPVFYKPNFAEGADLSTKKSFTVHLKDSQTGIKSYHAYLNGNWILMEYDYKTNSLVHYFDDNKHAEGKNELEITAKDGVGNSATFKRYFIKNKL